MKRTYIIKANSYRDALKKAKKMQADSEQSDLVQALRSKFHASDFHNEAVEENKTMSFSVNPKINQKAVESLIRQYVRSSNNINISNDNGRYTVTWEDRTRLPALLGKNFEDLWNDLVPHSGKADTVAGEILRAMNDIIYQFDNNGISLFEKANGVSKEASYLLDNVSGIRDDIDSFVHTLDREGIEPDSDEFTKKYNNLLYTLKDDVTEYIITNPKLSREHNDTDSRKYEDWQIEDMSPSYDYWLDIPNTGETEEYEKLTEDEDVSVDLDYISDVFDNFVSSTLDGAEIDASISEEGNEIIISGLNIEDYRKVKDIFSDDPSEDIDEYITEIYNEKLHDETDGKFLYQLLSAKGWFVDGLAYQGKKTEESVRNAIKNAMQSENLRAPKSSVEDLVEMVMESPNDMDSSEDDEEGEEEEY